MSSVEAMCHLHATNFQGHLLYTTQTGPDNWGSESGVRPGEPDRGSSPKMCDFS